MRIYIVSTGKGIEVAVEPNTKIASVMETVLKYTGIPLTEQILMSEGSRLDPTKLLSNYSLPAASSSTKDVFLYNKSHLRIQGPLPPEQVMEDIEATSSDDSEEEVGTQPQVILAQSSSPLHRVLFQYNEDFRAQLKVAQHAAKASKRYHQNCVELISEMEIQSKAIDSARMSVETHYSYIHSQLLSFSQPYNAQRESNQTLLSNFDEELDTLASIQLHPSIQSEGQTSLADFVQAPQLRSWAQECRGFHTSLEQKVSGLDGLFEALKADVEAVFMEAPSVNLEALAIQSDTMSPHVEEMASMAQVLERDCAQIQRVLSEGEGSSSSSRNSMPTALDNCSLMETVHENHVNHIMPRIKEIHEQFQAFYQQCVSAKNQMIMDVVGQLRRISSQQTRIQSMKNKLFAFKEAARKEAEMLQQLLVARRKSAAYRQCLSECMRRQAFSQLYAAQVEQLAEHMGKLRDKEQSRCETFAQQISSLIPRQVLTGLGLLNVPQHCQISLPPTPENLAQISSSDVQAIPLRSHNISSASQILDVRPQPNKEPERGLQEHTETEIERDKGEEIELENAKLKIELAQLHAKLCSIGMSQDTMKESRLQSSVKSGKNETENWQAVVDSQKDLISRLEQNLAATRLQSSAYASRIMKLENSLDQHKTLAQPEVPSEEERLVQPEISPKEATKAESETTEEKEELQSLKEIEEQIQGESQALPLTPISNSPDKPQLTQEKQEENELDPILQAALGSPELQARKEESALGQAQ